MAMQGRIVEDSMLRRMKVSHKSAHSILFIGVLMITLLMGCKSSGLTTTSPNHKVIQTQVIPQETVIASYYQTKAAQILVRATAESTGGGSSNEAFPYAPCVISALVIAVVVGIFSRSRRVK